MIERRPLGTWLIGFAIGMLAVIGLWSLKPPLLIGIVVEYLVVVIIVAVFGIKRVKP